MFKTTRRFRRNPLQWALGIMLTGNSLLAGDAEWIHDGVCPPPVVSHPSCDPCESSPHVYRPGHASSRHTPPAMTVPGTPPILPGHISPPHGVPTTTPDQAPMLRPDMQPRSTAPNPAPSSSASPESPTGGAASQPEPAPGSAPPQPSPSTAQTNQAAPNAAPANTDLASNNFNNISASDLQSDFGSTQSSFTSAPSVIGDFGGSGFAQISARIEQSFQRYALGSGGIGPTFDISPGGGFNPDVLSTGAGIDADGSNDGFLDTYAISEPLPPTDAPTAPGPNFLFQGGTAVYTNNNTDTTAQAGDPQAGELWHLDYTYAATLGGVDSEAPRPVPSPGVAVRRVKIAENFSAEIRNRAFLSYSFFNDSFGGLGDVSRYVLGWEQVLVDGLLSVETRLPIAATYASEQALDAPEDRDMEIGNFTVLGKVALLRGQNYLWSGGLGIGTPTADDTEINFRGADFVRIENETVQIQPFMGMLFRHKEWIFQTYLQLDIAAGGDPVLVNTNLANPESGQLQNIGRFTDSTIMHWDVSLHRSLYRQHNARWLQQVIGNMELHYTSTLQDADVVTGNNFTYTDLQPNFDIVNATTGLHLILGQKRDVIVTPAISVPLRDGLDEQFDYEGILQVNFLR